MKISKYIKLHGSVILSKLIIVSVCIYYANLYYEQNKELKQKLNNLETKVSKIKIEKKSESEIKPIISFLRPKLDRDLVDNYAYLINKYCDSHLKIYMIAIIEQESGFNSSARNRDDWGLGQINAQTWQEFFKVQKKEQLYNPILNIRYSCKILQLAYNTHYKRYKDKFYVFYHSWNSKPQKDYEPRIEKILKRIREAQSE